MRLNLDKLIRRRRRSPIQGEGDGGTTVPSTEFCEVLDPETPLRAAIAFCADAPFAPLAINLALSLEKASARDIADVFFVDLGVEASDAARLKELGVEVIPYEPSFSILGEASDDYTRAQTLRPNLPKILPGYEVLFFIDADIWVQDPTMIREFVIAANNERKAMAAVSELSWRSARFYQSEAWMRRFFLECTDQLIGGEEGRNVGLAPNFNSGLFTALADSPIWDVWTEAALSTYGSASRSPHVHHMAEQIALNWAFRRSGLFFPMDPLTNYAINFGQAYRDDEDRVVSGPWPPTPIRGVHLGNWTTAGRMYLEAGMLFERGRPLLDSERERLERIIK